MNLNSYNLDSERYMAKACAYLCRQCCFIDGLGEFGEFGEKFSCIIRPIGGC